jgi:hypothetical protein
MGVSPNPTAAYRLRSDTPTIFYVPNVASVNLLPLILSPLPFFQTNDSRYNRKTPLGTIFQEMSIELPDNVSQEVHLHAANWRARSTHANLFQDKLTLVQDHSDFLSQPISTNGLGSVISKLHHHFV